jgi:phage baseplate assembly protein V
MLRYGRISQIDPQKGMARVTFEEDGIVSDWLQLVVKNSLSNKYEFSYDTNEFVACLMDENAEEGVILGALYHEGNTPPVGNKDVASVTFSDGTVVKYDRSNSKLQIECVGDVEITCVKATVTASDSVTIDAPTTDFIGDVNIQGDVSSTGNIDAIGDVKAGPTGVRVSLLTHVHPTAAPGPPSPPTPTP